MKEINTIYTLSSSAVSLEKLHICTWDVKGQKAFIEVGIQLDANGINGGVSVYVYLPFINDSTVVSSLHQELSDEANFRFIFNRSHSNKTLIGGDNRNGSIFTIDKDVNVDEAPQSEDIAILNVDATIEEHKFVKFSFTRPNDNVSKLYGRVLLKTTHETLANTVSGITKKDYLYDIKINEARNMPDVVFDHKRNNNLLLCNPNTVILLHAIPEEWNINYSDSSRLKNVRRLEMDAFKHYMSWIEKVSDEYLITFSKADAKGGASFFTSFTKEHVGSKQLFVAVIMNILCSLLFAFSQIKYPDSTNQDVCILQVIPITYYVAIGIFIIGLLYVFNIHQIVWRFIKNRL